MATEMYAVWMYTLILNVHKIEIVPLHHGYWRSVDLGGNIPQWEGSEHVKNSSFPLKRSRDGTLNSRHVLIPQNVEIIVHISWVKLIFVPYTTKLFHNFNSLDKTLKMWKKCFIHPFRAFNKSSTIWNLTQESSINFEKNPYVCRIEFFPPKINVRLQLNCICHKVLTFPFLSPSKTSIYEVKLLKHKSVQLFTTIGTKKMSKEYCRIWK